MRVDLEPDDGMIEPPDDGVSPSETLALLIMLGLPPTTAGVELLRWRRAFADTVVLLAGQCDLPIRTPYSGRMYTRSHKQLHVAADELLEHEVSALELSLGLTPKPGTAMRTRVRRLEKIYPEGSIATPAPVGVAPSVTGHPGLDIGQT